MRIFLILLSVFFSTSSFALFCPTNFSPINIGDPIDLVLKQCGAPTTQKSYKSTIDTGPQQWSYYVVMSDSGNGTVKLLVEFIEGKVANMTINGMAIGATALCGNNISTGDTQDEVQTACGKPGAISRAQSAAGTEDVKTNDVTELKYGSSPAVTLIFENGKLKERK
jgi:hypothetical protein